MCDPASLDYIVVNHTEPDHTGSMKRLLELAPGATVLGSALWQPGSPRFWLSLAAGGGLTALSAAVWLLRRRRRR